MACVDAFFFFFDQGMDDGSVHFVLYNHNVYVV